LVRYITYVRVPIAQIGAAILGSVCIAFLVVGYQIGFWKTLRMSVPYLDARACNTSSTAILIHVSGEGLRDNRWLDPGQCTDQDPDVVWGKHCDPGTETCELQAWRVGPHSITVRDIPDKRGTAQPVLLLAGPCQVHCGWDDPKHWPARPPLDRVHYELRR
jgi:hypothetical protein